MQSHTQKETTKATFPLHHDESAPVKVLHIALWDHGGAGNAAKRLHDGLVESGTDSSMLVLSKATDDPRVLVTPPKVGEALLNEGGKIVAPAFHRHRHRWNRMLEAYPERDTSIEIFTDIKAETRLEDIPEFVEADVINLHWTGGCIDFLRDKNALLGKSIVWTMHDMNPFTGGCHYAGDCEQYMQACGECPLLGSDNENDLTRRTWAAKKDAFEGLDLTCVTPSRWLGECCGQSSLWQGRERRVIPYGLDLEAYKPYDKNAVRHALNIPRDTFLILFGAVNAKVKRKGYEHLLEMLALLKERFSDRQDIALGVFGHCGEELAQALSFPPYLFGYVNGEREMSMLQSLADVCLLPSLEDNLPNVGLEAAACGTPVVGFTIGGVPDIVDHGVTGYLVEKGDAHGLVDGVVWAMEARESDPALHLRCREKALRTYPLIKQARDYETLYRELLTERRQSAVHA